MRLPSRARVVLAVEVVLVGVLGALLGVLALRVGAGTRWWHWLVAVLPVPVGAVLVTAAVLAVTQAPPTGFALSVVAQLGLASAVGLALGTLRGRTWRPPAPPEAPLSYVVAHREDPSA